ncbi:MAG TPA: ATP-binding protein [Chthonomonadaceae bacterium]|nr:ATP-binding protein [Chthonomonadaceae bacterium]
MARTVALAMSSKMLEKARGNAAFWFSLLLSFWFVADSARDPMLGSAGLVPVLPALLMFGLAFALLALRSQESSACLLAAYLSMLAVLARDNTAGLLPPLSPAANSALALKLAYRPIHIFWALALGAVPLYFGWVYTAQDRAERPSRLQGFVTLGLFVCSALGQVLCILTALHSLYHPLPLEMITHNLPSPYHRLLIYTAPLLLAQHAAAFWLLLNHYRLWGEARNRALVLFFGVALLFIACVIINDSVLRLETCVLANLMAYLVPLMLVYALERHALFAMRISIRRTVQYALAQQVLAFLVLAPLVPMAFLWGLTWNAQPTGLDWLRSMVLRSETLIFGTLSLIFAVTLLIRVPLLRQFDRAYFREIYDAQRVLGQMGRSLLGTSDLREIGRTTLEGIDTVLHPLNAMLLVEEDGQVFCLARRNYTGYQPPLWPDPTLLAAASILHVPELERRDTARQPSWTDALPAPARALLEEAQIRLIVPLREEEKTTGVLLLGEKASGMAYTPEDEEILRALASQVALAMQSARLNREFLRRSTHELKAGSVGFVELVERERRLLAADLHDQTLPELRCLLADLESLADAEPGLSPPAAAKQRRGAEPSVSRMSPAEMVGHLRQSIENIRDIMESLRPSALEMLGLLPALENELRKAASRARPPVVPQFQVKDAARPENLSAFAEMSIFRIVQEAINNACRHAGASTVRIVVGVEDGEWTLRVEDDGVGLPVSNLEPPADRGEALSSESLNRGRGLDNMQYRASLIGAQIAWSVPEWGKGTCVELRLPLHGEGR